ncbi:MAG TPA: hypothetical protein VGS22_28070 [Thermoanaerobaculia bacterium]|jgi:hypothetical protein|nr:hypothetical protein [Thermoanaerobaculia bacterium]
MRRGTLQLWTLTTWFLGLISLESVVLFAQLRHVDAFTITRDAVAGFSEKVGQFPRDPGYLERAEKALKYLKSIMDVPLDVRTPREMSAFLQKEIPDIDKGLLEYLSQRTKGDQVGKYYLKLLSVYLPWLSIMLAGLFTDSTLGQQVRRDRAIVSIALSVLLQVVYIIVLVFSLFVGQIDATVNLQPVTVAVASFVGVWVQFVFPTGKKS